MDNDSAEIANDDSEDGPFNWVQWFCTLEGHEYLVDVDIDFIKDPFNLTGLDQ
jgi:casein kinase II subunit beta